jgi:hypothetical protein
MSLINCQVSGAFGLGCRDNTGGVKSIYILGNDNTTEGKIDSVAHNPAVTDPSNPNYDKVTSIVGSGSFYKFEVFRQTSDFTENITSTPENGTVFYDQVLNAVFFKMQQNVRNKVKELAKNPDLKVVIETNNGSEDGSAKWFLMGETNGAQLLSGNGQTGTAFGDMNGYMLTFSAQEPFPMSEVSGSASSFAASLSGITVVTP